MGKGRSIIELQSRLGYEFFDISYLQTALTHSSYTNEMKVKGFRSESNEALEFLGDAVLQIVISEVLFDRYRLKGEGCLTKMRQRLVCEDTLAMLARRLDLGSYLNIGTSEETIGLRGKNKALADAFEAVVAAIYSDDRENGNGTLFRCVIINLYGDEIDRLVMRGDDDYKTMLQKFVEKSGDSVLEYKSVETGPEHNKTFSVTAYINNNTVGSGTGKTKRSAEMEAAKCALELFGIL